MTLNTHRTVNGMAGWEKCRGLPGKSILTVLWPSRGTAVYYRMRASGRKGAMIAASKPEEGIHYRNRGGIEAADPAAQDQQLRFQLDSGANTL
eukprot:gene23127-biopygen8447